MPAHETYPADMSYYVAEDAAGRERTVAQVAELSWRPGFARPAACNGTVLMMDDRRPTATNHTAPGSVSFATAGSVGYYHKAFALNYLYAQRHGLDFKLVRPTRGPWLSSCVLRARARACIRACAMHAPPYHTPSTRMQIAPAAPALQLHQASRRRFTPSHPTHRARPPAESRSRIYTRTYFRSGGLCPAWCRVKILASLVVQILSARRSDGLGSRLGGSGGDLSGGASGAGFRMGSRPRHWILYIDSDAFLREQHTDFLGRLSGDPLNADVHVAIGREELPAGGFRSPRKRPHGVRTPSMNAGVLFVRASQWSSHMLAAWMRAPSTPVCAPFANAWPCEQQCFHELLRNRTLLPQGWRRYSGRHASASDSVLLPGARNRGRTFDGDVA
jgi:hypothetical protein